MASAQISREEMLKRIAHFKDLKPLDYKALGMEYVPEGREGFSIIGQVAKTIAPTIPGEHGFTLVLDKVSPGNGAPAHSHTTVEVFVPLSGQWVFSWGAQGHEEGTILGPWDTISFPVGVLHGYRNIGEEDAYFLAILGGAGVGEVTFATQGSEKATP